VSCVSFERWLPVPGYEGVYAVSDLGRLRSEARSVARSNGHPMFVRERILKASIKDGYRMATLYRPGTARVDQRKVHHLVALTFVGPRPEGADIRHLDGDSLHNCSSNLAYGTRAENIQDAVAHGTHVETRKTECPRGHALRAPNLVANRFKARGLRQCLACNRASTWGRKRGMAMSDPAVISNADERYIQIMQEA
jgi:hypothetical protein